MDRNTQGAQGNTQGAQDMTEAQVMVAQQEERRSSLMRMLEVEHSTAVQDVEALEQALQLANERLRIVAASTGAAKKTMPESSGF